MPRFKKASLFIQWHVTTFCDQKCLHCYMFDSPSYASESKNPLTFEQCCHIIDDLVKTSFRWGMLPTINFTGGDPLLRKDFFSILKYARASGVNQIGILGNPYHIDYDVAKAIKELGVLYYQISIDGNQDTHDHFRRPGSFQESIRAINTLKEVGVNTAMMFTLSQENAEEIFDVIRLAAELRVPFHFDRLVCVGQATKIPDAIVPPNKLRNLFERIYVFEKQLMDQGYEVSISRKTPLWKLFYDEKQMLNKKVLDEANANNQILGGCLVGGPTMAILNDGTVYPCRRLPVEIGRVPEQSIADILVYSPILKAFRDPQSWEKCRACHLKVTCRGCPAVAYGATGRMFGPDPQCWLV